MAHHLPVDRWHGGGQQVGHQGGQGVDRIDLAGPVDSAPRQRAVTGDPRAQPQDGRGVRVKLEADPQNPSYLDTIRGFGYRLAPE